MEKARFEIAPQNGVAVVFADGRRLPLHPLWLRERTSADGAFDAISHQRLFEPSDIDLNLRFESLALSGDGALSVRFSDSHECEFRADELSLADYFAESDSPPPVLWDAESVSPPRHHYADLKEGGRSLARFAADFVKCGFAIVGEVPMREGEIVRFTELMGPVRPTNFGALFDVKSKSGLDANDLAYTTLALRGHTDNPYRQVAPDIQLLHALQNEAKGGDSTLADGFKIAETIREEDPAAFRALSETPVIFRFEDSATHFINRAPLIELDGGGKLRQIRFSERLDYAPPLPPPAMADYYRGRKLFAERAESDRFQFCFRLSPGDLLMMNNTRLLHGRSAFESGGARHLQGCYMDMDPILGILRKADGGE